MAAGCLWSDPSASQGDPHCLTWHRRSGPWVDVCLQCYQKKSWRKLWSGIDAGLGYWRLSMTPRCWMLSQHLSWQVSQDQESLCFASLEETGDLAHTSAHLAQPRTAPQCLRFLPNSNGKRGKKHTWQSSMAGLLLLLTKMCCLKSTMPLNTICESTMDSW